MTLPARAVAMGGPSAKKLSRKLGVTSLGGGLARAVGVVTAEPVALLERSSGAIVLVDLVAGHDDHAFRSPSVRQASSSAPCRARWWQRFASGSRVGFAHQRLRRQVKDDLRIGSPRPRRADAPARGCRAMIEASSACAAARTMLPEIRHAGRRERIAGHSRTQGRSHSHSHAPLKPVCPVMRTRRPCQKSRAAWFASRPSGRSAVRVCARTANRT